MSPPAFKAWVLWPSGIRGDSDASAAALVVEPWLVKRPPPAGNPVGMLDGLCVFKSDKAEGFGADAVNIAFSKRPRNVLLTSTCPLPRQRVAAAAAAADEVAGALGGGGWRTKSKDT